jgi:hypothetical protein
MLWNGGEDDGTECEEGYSDTDWYRYMEYDMLCILTIYLLMWKIW